MTGEDALDSNGGLPVGELDGADELMVGLYVGQWLTRFSELLRRSKAIADSELAAVREMARCLRLIGEGKVPK